MYCVPQKRQYRHANGACKWRRNLYKTIRTPTLAGWSVSIYGSLCSPSNMLNPPKCLELTGSMLMIIGQLAKMYINKASIVNDLKRYVNSSLCLFSSIPHHKLQSLVLILNFKKQKNEILNRSWCSCRSCLCCFFFCFR